MHAKLVVIADDLTGASDVGIQFTKRHIPTSAVFGKPSVRQLQTGKTYGLVYDTETRNDIQTTSAHKRSRRDVIATGLADATAPLARQGLLRGILLTGGNMAAAFLSQIRAGELRLEREILQGVPLCRVISVDANGLKIATKAEGFGCEGCVRKIMDCLTYETVWQR